MRTLCFVDWGRSGLGLLIGTLPLVATACSGDDTLVTMAPADGAGLPEPSSTEPAESPLYALHITTLDANENYLSYILLHDSLDLTPVSLDQAREFPGFASIAAIGGQLLVATADEPRITSYTATPQLEWVEGPSLSFGNYGALDAGFWNQFFVDEHTAYLTLEVTSRVVWDPTTFEIRGLMQDTNLQLQRDGLQLEPTVSRQIRPPVPPVLRPFYYHDEDYFQFGERTPIAVYDPETNTEATVIDAPCPAVEVESRDEAGNAYFSAWTYGPELGMYGIGPALCIARFTADNVIDETWNPDLRSWTGGREIGVFRYMRDGKALATVLQQENIDADFSGEYDPEALAGDVWQLWLFDLENETAAPIEGLGPMNSTFNWANFDAHTFVMLPYDDWARTRVYEVDTLGNASERWDTTGSFYDWVQVR